MVVHSHCVVPASNLYAALRSRGSDSSWKQTVL